MTPDEIDRRVDAMGGGPARELLAALLKHLEDARPAGGVTLETMAGRLFEEARDAGFFAAEFPAARAR
jgi:hypothetical protein